jgi:hypothetical protein
MPSSHSEIGSFVCSLCRALQLLESFSG